VGIHDISPLVSSGDSVNDYIGLLDLCRMRLLNSYNCPMEIFQMRDNCSNYSKYKGKRKPRCCGGEGCNTCWKIYNDYQKNKSQISNFTLKLDLSYALNNYFNSSAWKSLIKHSI